MTRDEDDISDHLEGVSPNTQNISQDEKKG
jgi:hypothetical protein